MTRSRVFQIGFNKTGTSSLARFFRKNGFKVAGSEIVLPVHSNIQEQRDPFHDISFDLAQDLEDHKLGIYIYEYFEMINDYYPNGKFILTTRGCETWISSRLSHNGGRYVRRALRRLDLHDVDVLCDFWRREFYHYHAKVLEHFSGKSNFYIHSLETINVEKLLDFLEPDFIFKDRTYPHRNSKNIKKPISYNLSADD